MNNTSKVYVAGHTGMVGSAICRKLKKEGFTNLITRSSASLDLRRQDEVENFFREERPEYVFLAAAKVGGIYANNSMRAEFIYDNLMIQTNVIHASYKFGVKKLLFLGSSCIYPKNAPQPLAEDYLLGGPLEETNEPYAIAKIAGIKLCQAYRDQYGCNFIAAMPTNLYGPNDNYHLANSHVLPALLRKFHEAKEKGQRTVTVWGTGRPLREFLHVDDLADASLFLMRKYSGRDIVNVGHGQDISISELARLISNLVGFTGTIEHDQSKPDGTYRKVLECSRLKALGWSPKISLKAGILETYASVAHSIKKKG